MPRIVPPRAWQLVPIVAAVMGAAPPDSPKGPAVVRVQKSGEGYRLVRNGSVYLIKGAGGDGSLEALARAGGNSLRTWGAERAGEVLDRAEALGLSVTLGIWLGHERHGFDYNNADQVAGQFEEARRTILRYKDHPALLAWGLGNEMEGENGNNAAIWSAINAIASLAKRLDPNHPTMTVIAELGGAKVKNLHRLCPDVDIVGINSYAGVASVPERYQAAGGTKPFVITEFGPAGSWESKKTSWGVAIEPTSTAKAQSYRAGYERGVLGSKGICLGAYAFTWGHKQEATATWFGLLLPDGSKLAGVDALTELWSGKPPANRCPAIARLAVEGPDRVLPGATVKATLSASDPEGAPLEVRWVLQAEPASYGTGGDREEVPPTFPEAIVASDARHATVTMPRGGGGYRLFAYVHDGRGGAAVANVPLFVKGPVKVPSARKATLPLVVYDGTGRGNPPFVPTGWMGDVKALKVDEACPTSPHSGPACLKVDFQGKGGWAGVVWQDPPNDWGDRPGGWDLSGARRLTFWARGTSGGETLSFEFGVLGKDKAFPDSARGKLERVTLTNRWQQFRIELGGDLSRIKTGFVFIVNGSSSTFYLDDIAYE